MKIIGVDTNVLLSYRLQRTSDFSQSNKIIEECIKGSIELYIPTPVFLEIEWVLRSVYKQSREQVAVFLKDLLAMEHIIADNKEVLVKAVLLFKEKQSIKFTDALIAYQVKDKGYEFLTFDNDLKKVFKKIV